MSRRVLVCSLAVAAALVQASCVQASCSEPSGGATRASAAPAPAAPVPPPAGPRAGGAAYEVGLEPPAAVRPGESATARVVVQARGPYHVNRDYPMAFRPDSGATARFEGDKVLLGEGAERAPCKDFPGESCTVSAPLRFTAAPSGETRLAARERSGLVEDEIGRARERFERLTACNHDAASGELGDRDRERDRSGERERAEQDRQSDNAIHGHSFTGTQTIGPTRGSASRGSASASTVKRQRPPDQSATNARTPSRSGTKISPSDPTG